MSFVVGIDLSLCATGVVVLEDNGKYTQTLIKTKPFGKSPKKQIERIEYIKNEIIGFIGKYKNELIVIEGLAYGLQNSASASQLVGLAFILREWIKEENYILVPPTTLKKFITGKGNSAKEMMLLATYKKYKQYFTDNNLCDAYGLAQVGLSLIKEEYKNNIQEEVINKIKKKLYEL